MSIAIKRNAGCGEEENRGCFGAAVKKETAGCLKMKGQWETARKCTKGDRHDGRANKRKFAGGEGRRDAETHVDAHKTGGRGTRRC